MGTWKCRSKMSDGDLDVFKKGRVHCQHYLLRESTCARECDGGLRLLLFAMSWHSFPKWMKSFLSNTSLSQKLLTLELSTLLHWYFLMCHIFTSPAYLFLVYDFLFSFDRRLLQASCSTVRYWWRVAWCRIGKFICTWKCPSWNGSFRQYGLIFLSLKQ